MKTVTIPTFNRRMKINLGQFGMVRWGNRDSWSFDAQPQFTEWFNCRDSFHYAWDHGKSKAFFYAWDYEVIRDLIGKVEGKLNLNFHSKIRPCDWQRVTWIKPCGFWRRQPMRMSLFSILMRVAQHYKGDIDEALDGDPYAQTTKAAIHYFMDGHCRYVGKLTGWYQQFDTRLLKHNKQTLEQLLKRSTQLREIKLAFFG